MSANDLSVIKSTADSVSTNSRAYQLFTEQLFQIVSSEKYLETIHELIERPSSVMCVQAAMEIRSLMLNVVKKYSDAIELMTEWFYLTPCLLAIHLILIDKSPVKTNAIQRAQLTEKFDDGRFKSNHLQNRVRKTLSAIVGIVGKLAAMSAYMQDPTKSMVLNSMAAGAVIGKSFPELSHNLAKMKSLLDDCYVRIHSSNENVAEQTATADQDHAEELIPDGWDATIDFIFETLKDMRKALL